MNTTPENGIADALAKAMDVVREGRQAQEEAGAQTVEVQAAEGMIRVVQQLSSFMNTLAASHSKIVQAAAQAKGVE